MNTFLHEQESAAPGRGRRADSCFARTLFIFVTSLSRPVSVSFHILFIYCGLSARWTATLHRDKPLPAGEVARQSRDGEGIGRAKRHQRFLSAVFVPNSYFTGRQAGRANLKNGFSGDVLFFSFITGSFLNFLFSPDLRFFAFFKASRDLSP